MTLRNRFLLYLVVLHCVLALTLGFTLWRLHHAWILAVEVLSVVSACVAFLLFRAFYGPLRLLKSSADFLKETDFSTTLLPTGQPETDALVNVYNTMLTTLRAERLRVEEKGVLLQTLINASPTGIMLCDEALRVLSVNPALEAMLEIKAITAIGKHLQGSILSFTDFIQHLAFGESGVFSHKARRFKVQKAGFVERGVPHIMVMMEELTAELRASEKIAYERIIRILAHEVNNSTGAARSLMESALHYERYFAENTPDGERADYREALTVASERLRELGEFMQGYALVVRLPAPKPYEFDISELLVTTGAFFRELCKAHHITLLVDTPRVDTPTERILIHADKVQMQQALTNLVKNAIEAVQSSYKSTAQESAVHESTAHERTVTLSARHGTGAVDSTIASTVVIAVEDTGMGLNASAEANILTPFFTTKETGQGIGLMLVREITSAHDFLFTLENRAQGGAVATIVVPAKALGV